MTVSPELIWTYMSAFLLATCESSKRGMSQADSRGCVVSILLSYPSLFPVAIWTLLRPVQLSIRVVWVVL